MYRLLYGIIVVSWDGSEKCGISFDVKHWGFLMKYFIPLLAVVALVVVVLFSVQNSGPVTVWLYNWRFDASVAIVIFLSAFAGMAIEALFVVSLRLRRSVKRRARKAAQVVSSSSAVEEEPSKGP
jgi:uncharacterized integral membrane protein